MHVMSPRGWTGVHFSSPCRVDGATAPQSKSGPSGDSSWPLSDSSSFWQNPVALKSLRCPSTEFEPRSTELLYDSYLVARRLIPSFRGRFAPALILADSHVARSCPWRAAPLGSFGDGVFAVVMATGGRLAWYARKGEAGSGIVRVRGDGP